MSSIPRDLQSMPFGTMIGAPLAACVEAQEKAAMTTVNFIRNVGFRWETDSNGKRTVTDEVINVSFIYEREGTRVELNVPLLTIVPIPYIAIDTVNIDFKANLKSVQQTDDESNYNRESGWNQNYDGRRLDMNASVSTKKDSKSTQTSQYSVEATIDINVVAHQDSMPAGMAKVLEMLNQAIFLQPESAEEKKKRLEEELKKLNA